MADVLFVIIHLSSLGFGKVWRESVCNDNRTGRPVMVSVDSFSGLSFCKFALKYLDVC